MLISIVVPCYNEQEVLPKFFNSITKVAFDFKDTYAIDFEFIFIDDGSKDNTLCVLKNASKEDDRIKFISFSRNFGKESAIYAGIKKSKGDLCAIMDADLQDPPELLKEMYIGISEEGYDCVCSRRTDREGEPKLRSWCAKRFYHLMSKISDTEIMDGARDFRLMTRQMVDSILAMGEYNRFSKGIFGWVGFSTKWIEYKNIERAAGSTKWSFFKLLVYSLNGIIAFSTVPLAISSLIGLIFLLISIIMILVIVTKTMIWGDPVAGYPSMMCVIFFIGGIQLFSIGILGQYLSKTYLETKKRPIYISREEKL